MKKKPPLEPCGQCEHWPSSTSRKCYYDTLQRESVKKSSEPCDNFKRKKNYNDFY